MAGLARWAGFALGLVIVVVTFSSGVGTIVPRKGVRSRISYTVWRAIERPFMAAARMRRYESKDRLLGLLGPVSLLALLGAWLLLFLLGYALVLLPLTGDGFMAALRLSGSSLFTLGLASSPRQGATVVSFAAAATGLVVVALQVGYLPTIYGAYNRRETVVNMLESRAGEPAWGWSRWPASTSSGAWVAGAVLHRLGAVGRDLTEPRQLPLAAVVPLAVSAALLGGQPPRGAGRRRPVPGPGPKPGAAGGLGTACTPASWGCGAGRRVPSSCPMTLGRTRRSCSPTRSSPTGWTAWRRSVPDGAVPEEAWRLLSRLAGQLRGGRLPARRPAGGGARALVGGAAQPAPAR